MDIGKELKRYIDEPTPIKRPEKAPPKPDQPTEPPPKAA